MVVSFSVLLLVGLFSSRVTAGRRGTGVSSLRLGGVYRWCHFRVALLVRDDDLHLEVADREAPSRQRREELPHPACGDPVWYIAADSPHEDAVVCGGQDRVFFKDAGRQLRRRVN